MHPDTKQRLLNTFQVSSSRSGLSGERTLTQHQLPPDISPVEVKDDSGGVHISCILASGNPLLHHSDFWTTGSHGGHQSFYSWRWLGTHQPFGELVGQHTPQPLVSKLDDVGNTS